MDAKSYIIYPKVGLKDLFEVNGKTKKREYHFRKISQKHVDFLICDATLRPLFAIELDDKSHDQKDRKERDAFVNLILRSVGYKVIHTRYITSDILDLV